MFLPGYFCLAYSSALKMEAVRISENSVNCYQNTRYRISEDNIHVHTLWILTCFQLHENNYVLKHDTKNIIYWKTSCNVCTVKTGVWCITHLLL
jgi:hypothetical protein